MVFKWFFKWSLWPAHRDVTYWYADGAVYEGEYPYTPIPLNPENPENLP